jgi:hypothetical protein
LPCRFGQSVSIRDEPGSSGADRQITPQDGNIMSDEIDHERRRFFEIAAMTIAATQFGLSSSADAQSGRQKKLDARGFKPLATPADKTLDPALGLSG